MGRAVDGPVPPVDADEVWKRGSRERRMRRAAQIAPVVVIVGLVIGLVVVASGDDEAAPVFAGLTEADGAVVDEYLGVLEERGVLAEFPDERAAVEYAWRVECFGDIDGAVLYDLNAAVNGAVSALSLETVVSVGWRLGIESDAVLAETRAATDEAMSVLEDAMAQLPTEGMDAEEAEVLDVAQVRLEALPTVRQAIDDDVHPTLVAMADGLLVSAEDLLQVDHVWSGRISSGSEYRRVEAMRRFVQHEVAAAQASVGLLAVIDDPAEVGVSLLQESLVAADDHLQAFIEGATPEQKSLHRNAGGPQVRAYDTVVVQVLNELDGTPGIGDPPLPTLDEAVRVSVESQAVHVEVATHLADDLRVGVAEATPVDEAVAAACDATGDQILVIGPAAVGGVPVTLSASSAPPDTMFATIPE